MRRGAARRGFTLIEAVLVILMISIAIPPSISMMTEAAATRTDRVLLATSMSYAQAVADQVMADVSAGGLAVLDDEGSYLDAPGTGLWDRLAWVSEPYESRDLTAGVSISDLVDWQGEESADEGENLYRIVTITVTVPTSDGLLLEVPISVMLGEPNP